MFRVLSVEDNQINQMLMKTRLERAGYQVLTASNGTAVLNLMAAGEQFDLILMDINMPDMHGFEVAAKLKADQNYQQAPIIFVTAHVLDEYRERAEELGAAGFFTKPVDFPALFVKIEQLL